MLARSPESAVSEVLGEMLLLVVVVVLAAAFANYSLSLIPPLKNTPQTSIIGYTNGSNYTLLIQFGDPISLSELSLLVTYNYSYPNARTCDYKYSYTVNNVAVFEAGSLKAQLFLRPGYYNRSWSFGEKLNIPRNGSKNTVISVCSGSSVVASLHFPEG